MTKEELRSGYDKQQSGYEALLNQLIEDLKKIWDETLRKKEDDNETGK